MIQKFHNNDLVRAVGFKCSQTRVASRPGVVAAFKEQAVADCGS